MFSFSGCLNLAHEAASSSSVLGLVGASSFEGGGGGAPGVICRRKADPCYSECLSKGPSFVQGGDKCNFLQLI